MEDIDNIRECLILGIDITVGDEPTIAVGKRHGRSITIIHTIKGDEAKEIYEKLVNKKIETSKKDKKSVIIEYGKVYCPTCNYVLYGSEKVQKCQYCGQELDWEDINFKIEGRKNK
jgi:hypothetical protein